MTLMPDRFTKHPLHTIPDDCSADFPTDREAKSTLLTLPREVEREQITTVHTTTTPLNMAIVRCASNADSPREIESEIHFRSCSFD